MKLFKSSYNSYKLDQLLPRPSGAIIWFYVHNVMFVFLIACNPHNVANVSLKHTPMKITTPYIYIDTAMRTSIVHVK